MNLAPKFFFLPKIFSSLGFSAQIGSPYVKGKTVDGRPATTTSNQDSDMLKKNFTEIVRYRQNLDAIQFNFIF